VVAVVSAGTPAAVAADGRLIAVVNFGSQSVSLFDLTHAGLVLTDVVTTMSPPVSVTFGYGHLYVLGTTSIESHKLYGEQVDTAIDGSATLLIADGSAAQVGVAGNQLLITEKSNVVEVVDLQAGRRNRHAPSKCRFRRAAIRRSVYATRGSTG
jgi:DNA-binding beta-propeller fold protein YncE